MQQVWYLLVGMWRLWQPRGLFGMAPSSSQTNL